MIILLIDYILLNPLSTGIFTVFGLLDLVIRKQSVTQRSMGRSTPRYPSRGPGL